MTITTTLPRWTWRTSGHARLASLLTAWLLALASYPLGILILPIVVLRSAASLLQLALNHRLSRRVPFPRRDRYDWALMGATLAGSCLFSVCQRLFGPEWTAVHLLLVLIPFSGLQLRAVARSYAADRGRRPAPPVLLPIPLSRGEPVEHRRAA